MTDPCLLPATAQLALLAARELSAVELLDAHLARIARLNPSLNAVVGLDAAQARARWRKPPTRGARGARPARSTGCRSASRTPSTWRASSRPPAPRPMRIACRMRTRRRWRGCGRPARSSSGRARPDLLRRLPELQPRPRRREQPVGRGFQPRRLVGRGGGGGRHGDERLRARLRSRLVDPLAGGGLRGLRAQDHMEPGLLLGHGPAPAGAAHGAQSGPCGRRADRPHA